MQNAMLKEKLLGISEKVGPEIRGLLSSNVDTIDVDAIN